MRTGLWISLAAGALLLTAAPSQAQPAEPLRKPGWWALDITTDAAGPKPAHQTVRMCTDAAFDRVQTPFGVHSGPGCAAPVTSRAGDGWTVAATCKVGAITVSTTGRLDGDLAAAYRAALIVRMDPPPTPALGLIHVDMDAHRLGDCPAGKAPGDIDLSMSLSAAGAKP